MPTAVPEAIAGDFTPSANAKAKITAEMVSRRRSLSDEEERAMDGDCALDQAIAAGKEALETAGSSPATGKVRFRTRCRRAPRVAARPITAVAGKAASARAARQPLQTTGGAAAATPIDARHRSAWHDSKRCARGALLRFLRRARKPPAPKSRSLSPAREWREAGSGDAARFVNEPIEPGVLKRQVPSWLALPEFRSFIVSFEDAHVASRRARRALRQITAPPAKTNTLTLPITKVDLAPHNCAKKWSIFVCDNGIHRSAAMSETSASHVRHAVDTQTKVGRYAPRARPICICLLMLRSG
jgi:hypothetical protein